MLLKKFTKRFLASLLAISMIVPGSFPGVLQARAQEAAEQSSQLFVDVDDADKTTTGEAFKIQYSEGATWKSAKKDSYASILYNSSETYSTAGGTEYYYTMNFTGTGVQIFATVNTGHANCDVYIDDVHVGDLIAKGTKQQKQLVFEKFNLENEAHVLKVARKADDTNAMQLDMIRVYVADEVNYVDIDDAISTTGAEPFKIKYLPNGSWTGTAIHPELFYEATEHYTQQSAEPLSYEMVFTGTGIAISASTGSKHANSDVYIDDVYVGDLNAYATGDKQHKQILFETYGLENTEHTLRVAKKDNNSNALQLDRIRVFYEELGVSSIVLSAESICMGVGAERQITAVTFPWMFPAQIKWSSADETVATVDENGLIKAVAEEAAETIITAQVVGTEIFAEVKVSVDPNATVLEVSVGNEKMLDTQEDYDALLNAEQVDSWSGTAWRGDIINSKITVLSKDSMVTDVEVTASDFTNENGDILAADNFSIKWLKEIEAYNGKGVKKGELLTYPDIIHKGGAVDMEAGIAKFAWVRISVPENTKPGTYTGTITVNANEMNEPVELSYSVKVIDLVQPDPSVTEVQIWQHPYSVANYYLGLGKNVSIGSVCRETANDFYFTEQHLNLMRAEMKDYASMGGHDLVANIVEEAWNHQSFYGDPSMVKWTKNADGTWSFDYTWFDTWVEFAIECGVIDPENGVGKIKCYSMVPWGNYVTYYDEASGSTVKKAYTPGNADWKQIWTPFLTDFMEHTKEKGWFDITYISMDERSMAELEPTVELVETITDENGNHFMLSSCLNYSAPEYYDFTDHIHDISVGLKHTQVATSNALADHRRALGLSTTYYTCVGDYPSNFVISDPGDNYWNAWYTMTLGTNGYLRWAWNNYLYDMHGNVSYKAWEPGDGWFIYPLEREEVDMEGDCVADFYSTPRYEMFKQGIRDVAKTKYLMLQNEEMNTTLDELTGSIVRPQKGNLYDSATYANEEQRMLVHSETARVYEGMSVIAEEFVQELAEANAALANAITAAEALTLSDYTKETADAISEKLAEAKAVSKDEASTLQEIQDAAEKLETALADMMKKVNVAYYADVTATYVTEDGAVEACSQENAYKIVDGNTGNYWASDVVTDDGTIYIDAEDTEVVIALDGIYSVEDIVVIPYNDNNRRYAFNVFVSADGKDWEPVGGETIYDEENNLNPAGTINGYTYSFEEAKVISYVKVEGVDVYHPTNDTINNFHLKEVKVLGQEVGNIALYKDITSSDYASAIRVLTNANDGDISSYWDAGNHADRPWAVIDLEGLYELDSINVINYFTRTRYYQYYIEVSEDGERFTLAGMKDTKENETARGKDFNFAEPVRASQIKIVGTYCDQNEGFHLNEVRAYGKLVEKTLKVENGTSYTETVAEGTSVFSRDETIATAAVVGDCLTINGVSEGRTSIEVGDVIYDVIVIVNREVLHTAIETVKALNKDDYTAQSWAALTEVLEKAVAVQEDIDATAEKIQAAADAVTEAAGLLVRLQNVALYKPLTCSEYSTTNRPHTNINDGNITNHWNAGEWTNKPWIIIDLEGIYNLERLNVITYYASERYYQYEVYVSVDGNEYTQVAVKDTTESETDKGMTFVFEEPIQAGYIKVIGTYCSGNECFHLNELSAYGVLAKVSTDQRIRVACVGDSLTEGYKSSQGNKSATAYPAYLQEMLGEDYRVKNFGKSSMTLMKENDRSYWNTTEFEQSLAYQPDIVIIMLGTNDSKAFDEAAFRADAAALVNEYKALESNPRVIFAISPHCYMTEGDDLTAAKVDVVIPVQRALVEENGWETVDMYEKTEGKQFLYHSDLVHFTDSGYNYLAQCMYEALTGEIMPDATDSSRDIPVEVLRATTGSSQNGEGPERVLDGNADTLWHTEYYGTDIEGHWIQFELTEEYMVDGLRYQPRQVGTNGIIKQYEILISDNGEEWESVASGNWNADGIWKLTEFEEQNVKYVRLVSKDAVTGNEYVFASAAEIRLTGEIVEQTDPKKEVCEIYPDVIHGEWYESAVQYVHDNGIMTGSNGLFKPTGEDGKLLRQQFVMILWRMEGEPAAKTDAAIKDLQDINGDEWYIDALCWAYENGVVTGVGGTMFKGDSPITRQQLATMMYRYADKMSYDTSKTADYSDMPGANDVESYAAEAMAWAVGSGIISGSGADKALNPAAGATRAQIATVIQRFCEENK